MSHWRAGLVLALSIWSQAQEKGTLTLHLLLHPIGEERYEVARNGPDNLLTMNTWFEYSDRGRKRTVTALLRMKPDFSPPGTGCKSQEFCNLDYREFG